MGLLNGLEEGPACSKGWMGLVSEFGVFAVSPELESLGVVFLGKDRDTERNEQTLDF